MSESQTLIMVFAKAPVKGQVKTRLIPALGEETATELYKQLVSHTLNTVTQLNDVAIQLYCTPDTEDEFFQCCAKTFAVSLKNQKGGDLGERMQHAFRNGLHEYQQVIAIGCDCPQLSQQDIADAINALQQRHDACITPAYDGGYVLLGLKRFSPLLFEKIDWGSEQVMLQTRQQLATAGFDWHELPPRHDIDTPGDLAYCPPEWLKGTKYEMAG